MTNQKTTATNWDDVKVQASNSNSYFDRPTEPTSIRILTTPWLYHTHFIKNINGLCAANVGKDCALCRTEENKATARYVLGLYDYSTRQIKVWNGAPSTVITHLVKINKDLKAQDEGGITENDVIVSFDKTQPPLLMYSVSLARKNNTIADFDNVVVEAGLLLEKERNRLVEKSHENIAKPVPAPAKKGAVKAKAADEFDSEDFG